MGREENYASRLAVSSSVCVCVEKAKQEDGRRWKYFKVYRGEEAARRDKSKKGLLWLFLTSFLLRTSIYDVVLHHRQLNFQFRQSLPFLEWELRNGLKELFPNEKFFIKRLKLTLRLRNWQFKFKSLYCSVVQLMRTFNQTWIINHIQKLLLAVLFSSFSVYLNFWEIGKIVKNDFVWSKNIFEIQISSFTCRSHVKCRKR